MAKTPRERKPKSLNERALEIAREKYGLDDAFVAHSVAGTMRKARTSIHHYYVASRERANEPRLVLLDDAGDELDATELRRQDTIDLPRPTDESPVAAAAGAPAAVTIDPTENHLTLNQGDSHEEVVTVTIPPNAAVPRADVYFLADTTGSMSSILAAVQAGATTILTALNGTGLDLAYGVGSYKDFPGSPSQAFQHQLSPINVAASVTGAINAWSASGGNDTPEGQLFALDRLAEPPGGAIGWRSGSKRILVWFGDAPGHDPICAAISGAAADITEASVTAKLVAEHVTVLAISVANPGLDDDPQAGAGDYGPGCPAGGAAGQATRITNATGGKLATGIAPGTIVNTIIKLVKAAVSQVGNVSLVASGGTAPFVSSITPAGGYGPLVTDREHKLTFTVTFRGVEPCGEKEGRFDGSLDVVVDGAVVARKRVDIRVPACPTRFSYSVKFVCGTQPACLCECAPVRPGVYATEINIYNYHGVEVEVEKQLVPVVLAGAPSGREPRWSGPRATDRITLPPYAATSDDCCRLSELLLGGPSPSAIPLTIGFLAITARTELAVTAVYTVSDPTSGAVSMDVAEIQGRKLGKESRP